MKRVAQRSRRVMMRWNLLSQAKRRSIFQRRLYPRTAEEYSRPLDNAQKISEAVCQEFKRIREKKKMTHWTVAIKAGLSRGMVQHMETGFRNPTLMVAYSVAEALGVSLTDVIKKVEKQRKKPALSNK